MRLEEKDVVVFYGDSITDCYRDQHDPHHLGSGYALMAAGLYGAAYPENGVAFYNRGISGNRVRDLLARLEDDCLSLQPSVVSILIGINDTWRRFGRNDRTTTERFESEYRAMLEEIRMCTNARLILMEPFVLPVQPEQHLWREDTDPKIHAIRQLAREYGAGYVPLDGVFSAMSMRVPCEQLAYDGVHPTTLGHGIIAKAWLEAVGVTTKRL